MQNDHRAAPVPERSRPENERNFSACLKHEKGLHTKWLDFSAPPADNKGIENNQIQILVRQRGLNRWPLRTQLRLLTFYDPSPFLDKEVLTSYHLRGRLRPFFLPTLDNEVLIYRHFSD